MADIRGNLERGAQELREALNGYASEPCMRMDIIGDLAGIIRTLEAIIGQEGNEHWGTRRAG